MKQYRPGDFVACYVTNSEVYEELLIWGIVLEVSPTLEDILVLDKEGTSHWWPSRRWRPLKDPTNESVDIICTLA